MLLARLVASVAVASALVTAVGARVASAAPVCANGTVHVSARALHNSTAGSTYVDLVLTNRSARACALIGYPGVSAVDTAGHQLGTAAARVAPARSVVIAPGRSAIALLQITDVGVFPPSACRPVRAAGLRVYPPEARASQVVRYSLRACSRSGRVYLHVRAVAVA